MNFLTRLFKRKRKPMSQVIMERLCKLALWTPDLRAYSGISQRTIDELLCDSCHIEKDTAIKLSRFLGSEPAFWMNLSKNYFDKKGEKK